MDTIVDVHSKHQTSTSLLHAVAHRYHFRLSWNLLNEDGPPHCPTFHVKLCLTNSAIGQTEVFEGKGRSIKSTKQVVAMIALRQSSIITSVFQGGKTKPYSKDIEFMQDIVADLPSSFGPRADVFTLARIFKVPIKFRSLLTAKFGSQSHVYGSMYPTSYGDPVSPTPGSVCMHSVALHFGGRQFLGEATTRSGAEQEASLSAIKAVRRVLTVPQLSPTDLANSIRPRSSVWRLKVLAGLHLKIPKFEFRENFKVSVPSETTIDRKRRFTCFCSLSPFGTVEASGSSKSAACKAAAEMMLSCLVSRNGQSVSGSTKDCSRPDSARTDSKFRRKMTRSKTTIQFKRDRAEPDFGPSLHPITRLNHISLARGHGQPIYRLIHFPEAASQDSSQPNDSVLEFVYEVAVDNVVVKGPSAKNKRLAKRFSAECMLEQLGYRSPEAPTLRSVLRHTTRQNVDQNLADFDVDSRSPCQLQSSDVYPDSASCDSEQCITNTLKSDKNRHIEFSYARDVLIFDDSSSNNSVRTYGNRTGRDRGNPRKTASYSQLTSVGNRCASSSHDSTIISSAFRSTPIGHWSESQEAQSVGRALPMRRSRSCLEINVSRLYPSEFGNYTSGNLIEENRASSIGSLEQSASAYVTTNLSLLSRLSVFCLKEYSDQMSCDHQNLKPPTSYRLLHQLVSLCQRLHIPCQFVDRSLNLGVKESNDTNDVSVEKYNYHTVLSIGAAAVSSGDTNDEETANLQSIIVHGSGPTRPLARLRAAVSAFNKLTHLIR